MASKQPVHMNQGQGETSYARNSIVQNVEQNKMKPLIEAAILNLCSSNNLFPAKMVIADLGCSSGPNALALVSIAVKAIHDHCIQLQQPPPEVCVLLNDLPDNDFNTVVKSLVTLQSKDPVVVTGVAPGSFYERLVTTGSLHLVCSSNSLHWLSKAPEFPEFLTSNEILAYGIDEHARRERLPMVLEAYAQQFKKDFALFLELRAKELVPGGRMAVSLPGRRSDELSSKHLWDILAQILRVMALELRDIIQEEGSFSITEMGLHDPASGVDSALIVPSRFTVLMRAVFEPTVVQHFGDVMDEFVRTAERRWSRPGSLQEELAGYPQAMLVVALAKA